MTKSAFLHSERLINVPFVAYPVVCMIAYGDAFIQKRGEILIIFRFSMNEVRNIGRIRKLLVHDIDDSGVVDECVEMSKQMSITLVSKKYSVEAIFLFILMKVDDRCRETTPTDLLVIAMQRDCTRNTGSAGKDFVTLHTSTRSFL